MDIAFWIVTVAWAGCAMAWQAKSKEVNRLSKDAEYDVEIIVTLRKELEEQKAMIVNHDTANSRVCVGLHILQLCC